MYRAEVAIKNESGLHARPASMFVKEASRFKSDIKVIKNDKEYNAKSIMGILSMGTVRGDTITISADGFDEKIAVEALIKLVESEFDEA